MKNLMRKGEFISTFINEGTELRILIEKRGDKWVTQFWIDHQGFTVCEREDFKEADMYKKQLEIAFERLLGI